MMKFRVSGTYPYDKINLFSQDDFAQFKDNLQYHPVILMSEGKGEIQTTKIF
jgi:hypothetical protein